VVTQEQDLDGAPLAARGAVKSAYRTVEVLEALSRSGGGCSLSELQRQLRVPKSSLHELLQTLVSIGWVEVDLRTTTYRIGLRALRVGTAYLDSDPLVRAAGPLLAQLRNEMDETVHLARLDGSDVVYLISHESSHHVRVISRIARRLPAHSTALGKILLAMRSYDEVTALLPSRLEKLTPATVVDRAELEVEMEKARELGYSSETGQNTPGLVCFAVAVPGHHPSTDSVSCSMPLTRLNDEHAARVIGGLTSCADQLGQLVRSNGW
jgi:DNA-binding IclR family transcriptional regulator